ncbi:MAG: T9SS type A sorting domain-containing protein [Ignavibacteriae bacterium]|nr:T9SS C-terminal target domain-containing protein [Ignavibacteriota bacterium]NOG98548.1 T9SS type A sorting domain-containing protein [Ignavibacteriota bacterium]
MKRQTLILLILIISSLSIAQTNEFPIGVYISSGDTATRFSNGDYPGIKNLGVNLVLQYASNNPSNYDSLSSFDKLIALNADDSLDFIHHYTAGYYKKWQDDETAEEANTPGFKSNSSTTGYYSSNYKVAELDISTPGKYLLLGPDYDQDRLYRLLYGWYYKRLIQYKVNFNMKIDGNTTQADDVCIISVKYTSREGNDTTIVSDTLQADVMYNQFTNHSLVYSLPKSIAGTKLPRNQTAEFSVRNDAEFAGTTESYTGPYGVQFNIKWLGNRNLYVDFVEVYDISIGKLFSNPIDLQTLYNRCSTYASNYSNWSNLKYWYSLDEPHSIDNYEPYRIVDSILNTTSNTRLITAFYPEWNGLRNNENAMGDFVRRAKPYKTMPYYYPYWPGADKYNHNGLYGQKVVLQAPYLSSGYDVGDYWFIAQAMGFWDVDENDDLVPVRRRVKPAEMNASVMLALAHGAKGIIFWNYYSYYNSNNRYRCYGIVKARDSLYAKTDLYYKIKDNIAPRLTGTLGNTLKKIKYEGDYAHNRYGLGSAISDDYLPYLDISSTATDSANFHAGLLMDSVITDKRYYMIVNLVAFDSSMTRDLILELKNPLNKYCNYNFNNIESSYSDNKTVNLNGTSSFIDTITFSAGDGHLYELKPVLKYGGNLVYDDTVKTAISLNDEITIKPNADLVVEALYNIASDIYVEDGRTIKTQHPGGITFSNEAKFNFEDWSDCLVVSQNSGHPKLHWNEYVGESQEIRYEIYRKKNTSSFELIHTISDKSATEYIDNGVQIIFSQQANMTTAEYYIKLYELPSKNWVQTDQTNIAIVNQVQGIAPDKKGAEGNEIIKPHTFALEQNHPNPFNPTTIINYQIPELSHVTIKVYDILGKEIAELVNTIKDAGFYSVNFDATSVSRRISSGTYIYRMEAGKYVESKKMIILK